MYTYLLGLDGNQRDDLVLREDGVLVLIHGGDPDALAFQEWLAAGNAPGLPVKTPTPVPQSATKLGLKRALAEQGRWAGMRALIRSDPETSEDFDLATAIYRNDPMFARFVAVGQFTEAEIDAIFRRAVEIVASPGLAPSV